jgi:hypothetical protein
MPAPEAAPGRVARHVIRIAGSAIVLLFVAFQVVNPRTPAVANTPGFRDPVAAFELASRPDDVLGILGRPGDPRRAAIVRGMETGLRLDFVFLIAYPTFYVGIALLLGARRVAGPAVVRAVVALALAMAVGDALENRELLGLCRTIDPAAMVPMLARLAVFTRVKWDALFVASIVVVPGLWRAGGAWRWSAPLFLLAGAIGLVSVVHPPAIEWTIAPLGIAWAIVYVRGFLRTSAQNGTPLATTATLRSE